LSIFKYKESSSFIVKIHSPRREKTRSEFALDSKIFWFRRVWTTTYKKCFMTYDQFNYYVGFSNCNIFVAK